MWREQEQMHWRGAVGNGSLFVYIMRKASKGLLTLVSYNEFVERFWLPFFTKYATIFLQ